MLSPLFPTALMDFVGGNLDEFLHPERHAAQLAEQPGASVPPAAEAAPPPPPPPAVPPQVQYNPSMKVRVNVVWRGLCRRAVVAAPPGM